MNDEEVAELAELRKRAEVACVELLRLVALYVLALWTLGARARRARVSSDHGWLSSRGQARAAWSRAVDRALVSELQLPADHAYVQAARIARGRRRLTHVAPLVMPYGFVERRALCGAEPSSGLVEVTLASCDRVCERCARRTSS